MRADLFLVSSRVLSGYRPPPRVSPTQEFRPTPSSTVVVSVLSLLSIASWWEGGSGVVVDRAGLLEEGSGVCGTPGPVRGHKPERPSETAPAPRRRNLLVAVGGRGRGGVPRDR